MDEVMSVPDEFTAARPPTKDLLDVADLNHKIAHGLTICIVHGLDMFHGLVTAAEHLVVHHAERRFTWLVRRYGILLTRSMMAVSARKAIA